ncbi:hypothetical protein [Rufibacter quisquiliarum]|uniref:Uncharacterized protein n=1 Tax=Rufibacter quisquiliarum TaxID=1549639 RepID=A0A839GGP3_9BACT|nr:hypothetical protein [Rufibacter quisquiliarum]MBA9075829.1 hypothetical protein [Rufibacter quisquiliarum]
MKKPDGSFRRKPSLLLFLFYSFASFILPAASTRCSSESLLNPQPSLISSPISRTFLLFVSAFAVSLFRISNPEVVCWGFLIPLRWLS